MEWIASGAGCNVLEAHKHDHVNVPYTPYVFDVCGISDAEDRLVFQMAANVEIHDCGGEDM